MRYGQQILKCKLGFFSQLVPVVVANRKEKTHFVQEVILEELAFTVVDGGCGDSQTR